MGTRHYTLSLFLIGILASAATAETQMTVDVGWNGHFRAGRWGPVFVTVADSSPRAVELTVESGHDLIHSIRVHQTITASSTPATYPVYIPLQGYGMPIQITLRDARTRKRLAHWNQDDYSDLRFMPVDHLIGISGRQGGERILESQLGSDDAHLTYIPSQQLPTTARGFDAFDAIFLNQPDFTRLAVEQQQALLDWVRAGGQLVCWMSEDALPGGGPILEALPAIVGENIALQLSAETLGKAGLADRFRTIKGRNLLGHPGSREIPLLNATASAWQRSLGIGSITLLPLDISGLMFDQPQNARDFWKPLLSSRLLAVTKGAEKPTADVDPTTGAGLARSSDYPDFRHQRASDAINAAMNMLSDVPGAGDFGFSYVLVVLIALMLLVGPIDWIILKKLGRQPWTWITTSGWIGLITLGAVYIGYFFKSGDLHYRSLRLIDQADGVRVATVDVAGIYSPRSGIYELKVEPTGWWEPLAIGNGGYTRSRATAEISFQQDYQSNLPDRMFINVWSMRFAISESIAPGSPLIKGTLRRETREGREFLVGSLINVGTAPLKNLAFLVAGGRGTLKGQTIEPNQTLEVDAPISRTPVSNTDARQLMYRYDRPAPVAQELIYDLAVDRSLQIEQTIAAGSSVCLFAQVDAPTPTTLAPPPTVERQQQYVRALLRLEPSAP